MPQAGHRSASKSASCRRSRCSFRSSDDCDRRRSCSSTRCASRSSPRSPSRSPSLFHLNHGYWVTLTVVVILQPFAATTRQKALQRVDRHHPRRMSSPRIERALSQRDRRARADRALHDAVRRAAAAQLRRVRRLRHAGVRAARRIECRRLASRGAADREHAHRRRARADRRAASLAGRRAAIVCRSWPRGDSSQRRVSPSCAGVRQRAATAISARSAMRAAKSATRRSTPRIRFSD